MAEVASTYEDIPVQFGPSRGLLGILTVPTAADAQAPVVVVPNAGVLHRVGANRIHVAIARALAREGVRTLRYDLSGIGDSARRDGAGSLQQAVDHDLADALAFLSSRHDAERFVPLGLCSGAHDALRLAAKDPRVVGVVTIDVSGSFRNLKHVILHYGRRLANPASWRHALTDPRSAGAMVRARFHTGHGDPTEAGIRGSIPRPAFDAILRNLTQRGVRSLCVFTAGFEENYNYFHQFRDVFPKHAADPNVSYHFFPKADHTFGRRDDRLALLQMLRQWFAKTSFREISSSSGRETDGEDRPSTPRESGK